MVFYQKKIWKKIIWEKTSKFPTPISLDLSQSVWGFFFPVFFSKNKRIFWHYFYLFWERIKWRFPNANFDSCCSSFEKKQYYLKTCNTIFNQENIECFNLMEGSIILFLKSTRIDLENGVLNALSGIQDIGGHSTKDHHKCNFFTYPGRYLVQKTDIFHFFLFLWVT